MSRLVKNKVIHGRAVPTSAGAGVRATATAKVGDADESYAERAAKYVPAEIVAAYAALDSIVSAVPAEDGLKVLASWLVFTVGLVATPAFLIKTGPPKGQQWVQVVISTIAFVVWAYTLGGPFAALTWYRPWLGGLVVGLYTFLVALFQPREPGSPVVAPDPLPS